MQDSIVPIATAARPVKLAGRPLMACDDKPTFWERVAAGDWEPGALQAIVTHVGPKSTFLDLGAWIGPTTLLAALLEARCFAVEADPQALIELRGNLAANPELERRVTVIGRAVSPTGEPVTLAARRKPGDSMSSALLVSQGDSGRTIWQAEAVTPAELAGLVGPDTPLFIKLDIEGGEFALLPQCAPLLRRNTAPTTALVSFHPGILRETGVAPATIIARMAEALAPFQGWSFEEIDPPAATGRTGNPPDAQAIAEGRQSDTWLFLSDANQSMTRLY